MEANLIKDRRLEHAVAVKGEIEKIESEQKPLQPRPPTRGAKPEGDVALASKGARATAEEYAERIIDGATDNQNRWARGKIPCEFLITLDKVYALSEIRILLYDLDGRRYRYGIETSIDGKTWQNLLDKEKRSGSGWVEEEFDPTDVRHIKIRGLGNSENEWFHIVELIAK